MIIDVTTTATLRPDILHKTYKSFFKQVRGNNLSYRLILNIDLIGDNISPKKVVDVARRHFKNIDYNITSEPCFTKAVMWCWSQTKADYVFHLEDDWLFLKPVDLSRMIYILQKNKGLCSLRLSKSKLCKFKCGLFEYCKSISLNPNLFRGSFLRTVVGFMDETKNPEKQLRVNDTDRGKYLSGWKNGIYTGSGRKSVVYDVGRMWMENTKYKKNTGFMFWGIK